jgi:O-antigen ligase
MLKSEPLLGVGYGQFLDHHTLTAHNSFVLCFAEAGLIGYFFWLGIIVVTVIQLQGLKHLGGDDPPKRELQQLARAFQLALIAFMTAAFFLSRSFIPMLYLLTGLCVALVLIARDAKQPVWSPSIPQIGTVILTCEVVSILFMYALLKVYRA